MARTRAKLRLEYLLAFRHLELPSPRCHGVLLAISAGDTRRQRELDAGQHLLDCEVCAALSEPLDRRSIAMTAIAVPVGLVVWAAGKARAHPVQATATAGTGAAAAAAVIVALSLSPHHPAPKPAPAVAPSAPASLPPAVISRLSIAGRAVPDAEAGRSIHSLAGRAVIASGATVVEAVTRNGFWIGSSRGRLWVELVGPVRALLVQGGDRVWFTGVVVGNSPSHSALAGVAGSDAALLARQGAYVAVSTTRISVRRG
jgi:hypothetical protein